MVKRLGGFRHKTRYKLSKAAGEHGKLRITARLQKFEIGQSVALIADSAVQSGMFHPRHHGKTGVVIAQQGRAYQVRVSDKGKAKTLIALPVHLKHV